MKTLHVIVSNKTATFSHREGGIVCGNADYRIQFHFDSEWDAHESKTARFIWGSKRKDVVFSGAICPVPIVANTEQLEVGVYVENLSTTTPAKIPCERSILCNTNAKADGTVIVPEGTPTLIEKTCTENGTYTPDNGCDGFSKVIVQVAETSGSATVKEWQTDTVYNPGEIVTYNGEYYVCIKTTQGFLDNPEYFPDEWKKISGGGAYKGEYSEGENYSKGDIVLYDGNIYQAKENNPLTPPYNDMADGWDQLTFNVKPSGTKQITTNGTHDVTRYESAEVNVLSESVIPEGYIQPNGTKQITENGIHDVTSYASAEVNVPTGTDTSDADVLAEEVISGKIFYGSNGRDTGTMPSVTENTPTLTLEGNGSGSVDIKHLQAFNTYLPAGETKIGTVAEANLIPSNIKKGVTICGVTGEYEGSGGGGGLSRVTLPAGSYTLNKLYPDDYTNYPYEYKYSECVSGVHPSMVDLSFNKITISGYGDGDQAPYVTINLYLDNTEQISLSYYSQPVITINEDTEVSSYFYDLFMALV